LLGRSGLLLRRGCLGSSRAAYHDRGPASGAASSATTDPKDCMRVRYQLLENSLYVLLERNLYIQFKQKRNIGDKHYQKGGGCNCDLEYRLHFAPPNGISGCLLFV
jgi:hypothetical protein